MWYNILVFDFLFEFEIHSFMCDNWIGNMPGEEGVTASNHGNSRHDINTLTLWPLGDLNKIFDK